MWCCEVPVCSAVVQQQVQTSPSGRIRIDNGVARLTILCGVQLQNTWLTQLPLLPAVFLGPRSQAQHGEATLAETLAKSSKASSELAALRTENQSLMQVSWGTFTAATLGMRCFCQGQRAAFVPFVNDAPAASSRCQLIVSS
jgi:hypothetical protein